MVQAILSSPWTHGVCSSLSQLVVTTRKSWSGISWSGISWSTWVGAAEAGAAAAGAAAAGAARAWRMNAFGGLVAYCTREWWVLSFRRLLIHLWKSTHVCSLHSVSIHNCPHGLLLCKYSSCTWCVSGTQECCIGSSALKYWHNWGSTSHFAYD